MIYYNEAGPMTREELGKFLANMQRLRQQAAATPWQPIETAPKDGTKVLVLGVWRDGGGFFWDVAYHDGGNWEAMGEATSWTLDYDGEVTHWMPLPDPPK